jgi:hypothetical protein
MKNWFLLEIFICLPIPQVLKPATSGIFTNTRNKPFPASKKACQNCYPVRSTGYHMECLAFCLTFG